MKDGVISPHKKDTHAPIKMKYFPNNHNYISIADKFIIDEIYSPRQKYKLYFFLKL